MAVTGITPVGTNQAAPPASAPPVDRAAIDREMFLRLLITQVTNQNPLDPVSGSEFTAQLAQLSTLESLQQLNSNFRELLLLQGLGQGANLIGKTILFEQQGQADLQSGFVQAVTLQNGRVFLEVANALVGLDQVRGIQAGPSSP